ncbi:MAG: ribose 5-phosphate isomerase B [Opitutaceae bacterium]|nr:ribose 5-phosphate isomerase B [Cytophagales bacterium]
MKIAISSDHAGVEYKRALVEFVQELGYFIEDLGPYNEDSVDYPDFAHKLAEKVLSKEADLGIVLCGTGNGVAMAANKHQGIRAGLCWNKEIASLIRQHNDANILALPARFVNVEEAKEIVKAYLETPFEGGRHQRRVDKIACM